MVSEDARGGAAAVNQSPPDDPEVLAREAREILRGIMARAKRGEAPNALVVAAIPMRFQLTDRLDRLCAALVEPSPVDVALSEPEAMGETGAHSALTDAIVAEWALHPAVAEAAAHRMMRALEAAGLKLQPHADAAAHPEAPSPVGIDLGQPEPTWNQLRAPVEPGKTLDDLRVALRPAGLPDLLDAKPSTGDPGRFELTFSRPLHHREVENLYAALRGGAA